MPQKKSTHQFHNKNKIVFNRSKKKEQHQEPTSNGVNSSRSLAATKRSSDRQKPVSRSKRAGLSFPIGRIDRFLRKGRYAPRISCGASVFMTSVLEYLSAEELAGNACIENNKRRLTPRHILLAIKNDDELAVLLKKTTISAGGVLPSIHSALLPKKSGQPLTVNTPVNHSSE